MDSTGNWWVVYGAMSLQDCIAGWYAGGGKTSGGETGVNLSSSASWGTGTETAIFELFVAGSAPFELANRTVQFAGAGLILWQSPIASPSTVPAARGRHEPRTKKN